MSSEHELRKRARQEYYESLGVQAPTSGPIIDYGPEEEPVAEWAPEPELEPDPEPTSPRSYPRHVGPATGGAAVRHPSEFPWAAARGRAPERVPEPEPAVLQPAVPQPIGRVVPPSPRQVFSVSTPPSQTWFAPALGPGPSAQPAPPAFVPPTPAYTPMPVLQPAPVVYPPTGAVDNVIFASGLRVHLEGTGGSFGAPRV